MKTVSEFDWDQGNWSKCQKHGVSPAEIEAIFEIGVDVMLDRTGQEEPRFNAVGVNKSGRHIFVVFTIRVRDRVEMIRPISARYMHKKDVRAYEESKTRA